MQNLMSALCLSAWPEFNAAWIRAPKVSTMPRSSAASAPWVVQWVPLYRIQPKASLRMNCPRCRIKTHCAFPSSCKPWVSSAVCSAAAAFAAASAATFAACSAFTCAAVLTVAKCASKS